MSLDIDDATDQSAAPESADTDANDSDAGSSPPNSGETGARRAGRLRGIRWSRVLAYGVLPLMAALLAAGAGYLKWLDMSAAESRTAAMQSVQTASDTTVAMLAYRPDTVDKDLTAAADRLTGDFRDDYLKLIHDVVIPGSKEKQIGAAATVQAAASVSATNTHAVVLLFVNQTTTIGNTPPTNSLSSVRVTLDKVNDRWLVSQFEPV